jgi:hypothetical protein
MKTYLLVRPEHDDTTHFLSAYARETAKTAEKNGFAIVDIDREKANRKEVEGRLEKMKPRVVFFNGHGNERSIMGHKHQLLIVAGENEDILSDKIVYAISCKSAAELGPSAVAAGCESFVGYDDDFIFLYSPEHLTHPLQDETARLFLLPSNRMMDSLLKGNNVEEAVTRCKEQFREHLLKVAGAEDSSLLRYLWWDMKHLQALGNGEARA